MEQCYLIAGPYTAIWCSDVPKLGTNNTRLLAPPLGEGIAACFQIISDKSKCGSCCQIKSRINNIFFLKPTFQGEGKIKTHSLDEFFVIDFNSVCVRACQEQFKVNNR